ncbi:MAG: hypothetical protein R3300_04955 [Candidatus Promineifilaceae bacterium]|nr:hypothetical protein [Candidatus Promineifilaceae bacterium]
MAELHVYVAQECWFCDEARRLVAKLGPQFPHVTIELRDLDDARRPDAVFATPTYVLDGRIISLGNPTESQLSKHLTNAAGNAVSSL